jgi:hypothetical protein
MLFPSPSQGTPLTLVLLPRANEVDHSTSSPPAHPLSPLTSVLIISLTTVEDLPPARFPSHHSPLPQGLPVLPPGEIADPAGTHSSVR